MRATISTICAIVLLMAAMCAYSNDVLNTSVSQMVAHNERLSQSAAAGDARGADSAAQSLWQDWRLFMPSLAALLPHEALDNVSLTVTDIWQLARQRNYTGLMLASGELGEHLDHLLHKEKLSWENLM